MIPRPLLPLAVGLLLAGCGSAKPAAPSPTPTPVYAPKPTATHFIHLLDSRRFEPAELQGEPAQLVKLVLVGDKQKHDFTSPGLNVNIDVPPGSVQIIYVELPATPGSYEFWSAQPGDREGGMTGRFDVQPSPPSP
jgi:uncharacterized cupredoxin-like copper-binding protein